MRVHPEVLRRQRLPAPHVGKKIWDQRLADIAHFEDYLTRQGTIILKFFLHLSRAEQKKRFMQRLERPCQAGQFRLDRAKQEDPRPNRSGPGAVARFELGIDRREDEHRDVRCARHSGAGRHLSSRRGDAGDR